MPSEKRRLNHKNRAPEFRSMASSRHLTNEWPEQSAAPGTHARVLELVKAHLSPLRGKRIADVPCGAGALSRELAALGADLVPIDIAPVEPFLGDRRARVIADANRPLPFSDGEFDALVTVEGIEHLENPSQFLRECARTVRPGGFIFLSTPNVDSLRSRRYALLYGFPRYFGPATDTDKDSGHIHPIDMVFMRGATKRAGLSIIGTAVNRIEKKGWLTELLRSRLTRRLPACMRGEIPFYGDCIIYVLAR